MSESRQQSKRNDDRISKTKELFNSLEIDSDIKIVNYFNHIMQFLSKEVGEIENKLVDRIKNTDNAITKDKINIEDAIENYKKKEEDNKLANILHSALNNSSVLTK